MPEQDRASRSNRSRATADAASVSSASRSLAGSAAREEAAPSERDAAAFARSLALPAGATLRLRAIRPDDAPRLQAFHGRLSPQAICFRFFGVMPELNSAFAERLSHVDYEERMAIVVTPSADIGAPIIAVARYERTAPEEAEFALVVEDDWQGRGIGPRLLWALAEYAHQHGITTFTAEVMYTNERMLALLRHARFPVTMRMREGRIVARLDIAGAALL